MSRPSRADLQGVKQSFNSSVGRIEILLEEESGIISVYRFGDDGRPVAASVENLDFVDLRDLLTVQVGVPRHEASEIAAALTEMAGSRPAPAAVQSPALARPCRDLGLSKAGLALRFVAVLLDAVIVLFPVSIVVGLLSGGGYTQTGNGSAYAGIVVAGNAVWMLLALALGYYVVCEAMTGATLGKRMVGIRVVGEDGEHPTLGAAVVRNLLRVVDSLFFYLVGAIFALKSPLGQRLGDRAARTVVVRR
jgi:uncharacterized RDD family membrane protein YckC